MRGGRGARKVLKLFVNKNIEFNGDSVQGLAIQTAVSYIRGNNSIVFLMDLNMRLPTDIFNSIRKVMGGEGNPKGPAHVSTRRYIQQYQKGTYKSDWDTFGGMNVKEFVDHWGGEDWEMEDWEMADRVLNSGIEIERI
ncbi:predicted protein [Nematostella vectensis]|uniref:Hexosyltransferase n=1 Tax=Nematostella vectensis TaxID=45351 RepID=A7RYR8_NEMVE|nr:predicted protein [Nematostella vectensis]|eukprot:XP_001635430.1 predicted protein [Nematostella vectensis]